MAEIRKILVAYDGSPQSKVALEWAIDLGLTTKAQIAVAKVVEMMLPGELNALYEEGAKGNASGMYEEGARNVSSVLVSQIEELSQGDQKLLEEVVAKAGANRGADISTAVLHGNVTAAILDFAREQEADLIVAGTKGHGALDRLLIGSVARNLVSLSPIPVLIVKGEP